MKDSEALAVAAMTLALTGVGLGCAALSQNPVVKEATGKQEVRDAWREVAGPLEHALRLTAREVLDAVRRQRVTPGPSAV